MKEITKEYRIRITDTEEGHVQKKRVVEDFVHGELGGLVDEYYTQEVKGMEWKWEKGAL